MIHEVIVTTQSADGTPHIAPMGIRRDGDSIVIAPFRPSTTLDNILATNCAVVNYTDDVRIFAGCLTGRSDWPLQPANSVSCSRLVDSLSHEELVVEAIDDDETRPRATCRIVETAHHLGFGGFNRAQAAVLEAAILVSRLNRLPQAKIAAEIDYLTIAIDKTAGPREKLAWSWLMEPVAAFLRQ